MKKIECSNASQLIGGWCWEFSIGFRLLNGNHQNIVTHKCPSESDGSKAYWVWF